MTFLDRLATSAGLLVGLVAGVVAIALLPHEDKASIGYSLAALTLVSALVAGYGGRNVWWPLVRLSWKVVRAIVPGL